MKLKSTGLFCAILAAALILGGCAKPPTEEMNKAAEAVTRAENDANAVAYAGGAVTRAREALNRMQTEADSKRYDDAKSSAAEAVAAAEKAIADGKAGAARARDEASALVNGLQSLAAETEQGLSSARTSRLALDYEGLDQEMDTARRNIDQAETALNSEQYQEALSRGRNAQAGLSGINQKLSGAVMATSRKK